MPYPTQYDILPDAQKKVWNDLLPAQTLGFVLYGGTALALRYGHRESIDFDFFSDIPLDKTRVLQAFPSLAKGQILQDEPNTLVGLVTPNNQDWVKLSFFGGLNIGRVGFPELSEDGMIVTASVRDLLATKLKVLFDRIEPKDYIDIAEMIRRGADLNQGLADAKILFPAFAPMEALRALCWFNEPSLEKLPENIKKELIEAAKKSWGLAPLTSALSNQSLYPTQEELKKELSQTKSNK